MHKSQNGIYNFLKSTYDFVRGKSSNDCEYVEYKCHVDFPSRIRLYLDSEYLFKLYFTLKNGTIIKLNYLGVVSRAYFQFFDFSVPSSSIYLDIGGIQLPFYVLDRKSQKLLRKICVFVTKKKFSERQREKREFEMQWISEAAKRLQEK